MRTLYLFVVALVVLGCSDDSSNPDSTAPDLLARDAIVDQGPAADQSVNDQQLADQNTTPDATGLPVFEDSCPPTGVAVTGNITLAGTTKVAYPTSICSSTPYAQVVALQLTQQHMVQLNVTSAATLTILAVWDDCTTFKGCKAGEAKTGMTYEVTRDPGTHYVIVGTNSPQSFSLEIKLL